MRFSPVVMTVLRERDRPFSSIILIIASRVDGYASNTFIRDSIISFRSWVFVPGRMSRRLTSFLNSLAKGLPPMKKLMLEGDIVCNILKILSPGLIPHAHNLLR